MCYADTTTNDDGTAIAFCYCGWAEDSDTPDAAEAAAAQHRAETDAADATALAA